MVKIWLESLHRWFEVAEEDVEKARDLDAFMVEAERILKERGRNKKAVRRVRSMVLREWFTGGRTWGG